MCSRTSSWVVLFVEAPSLTACRYFKDPNLNVDNMASVSKAGKGLLVWVTAITKYYDVARNVEPLRIKVREHMQWCHSRKGSMSWCILSTWA